MRLIDADALMEDLDKGLWGKEWDKALTEAIIKDAPTIDPTIDKEAVGHWDERYIKDDECPWTRRRFYCSHCGKWQTYGRTKFCSNCGAKMEVKK